MMMENTSAKILEPSKMMIRFPDTVPLPGETIRVSGQASPAFLDGDIWKHDFYLIKAPLAENYPPPTPINCVDIKTYPAERRAYVDSSSLWLKKLFGLSRTFWALFDHIKLRKVPLTCPVIIQRDRENTKTKWLMTYVYRTQ